MILKSANDFGPRKRAIWCIARRFIPRRQRFFFEGYLGIPGQLWYAERKLLYETIRNSKPLQCFEIGTWHGGGSTLFITQALYENQGGILHTIEVDPLLQHAAKSGYERHLPQLLPHVEFHLGGYREVFSEILRSLDKIDFLFLDGAEDGSQTLAQYLFFSPWLKTGSMLMLHDWLTEKCRSLKPIIENTIEWKVMQVLLPPSSVGIILARKI